MHGPESFLDSIVCNYYDRNRRDLYLSRRVDPDPVGRDAVVLKRTEKENSRVQGRGTSFHFFFSPTMNFHSVLFSNDC